MAKPNRTTERKRPALAVHFGRKKAVLPAVLGARLAAAQAAIAESFPKLAPTPEHAAALALAVGVDILSVGSEYLRAALVMTPELTTHVATASPKLTHAKALAMAARYKPDTKLIRELMNVGWLHDFVVTQTAPQSTETPCSPAADVPASS